MINIVLHQPEIPYNTGNIGRTCVITGAALHLIRPYGFMINDKMIKRAGLDYWDRLEKYEHINTDAFYEHVRSTDPGARIFYATTKGKHRYTDVQYRDNDYIMFGSESSGIPEEILSIHPDDCIRIPMLPDERSLNLSNSVAIVLYEALRQLDFPGLESEGEPHRLTYCK